MDAQEGFKRASAFAPRIASIAERMKSIKDDSIQLIEDLAAYASDVQTSLPEEQAAPITHKVGELQMSLLRLVGAGIELKPVIERAH